MVTIDSVDAMLTMRPAPALDQVRHRESDQPGMGGEIHVERAGPVRLELALVLERRVDQRDPGVVHDDVEPAAPTRSSAPRACGARRARRRHTSPRAPRRHRARPDLVDHRTDGSGDVGHHDARAFVGEELRRRSTHAARRAGDDRHLPSIERDSASVDRSPADQRFIRPFRTGAGSARGRRDGQNPCRASRPARRGERIEVVVEHPGPQPALRLEIGEDLAVPQISTPSPTRRPASASRRRVAATLRAFTESYRSSPSRVALPAGMHRHHVGLAVCADGRGGPTGSDLRRRP